MTKLAAPSRSSLLQLNRQTVTRLGFPLDEPDVYDAMNYGKFVALCFSIA